MKLRSLILTGALFVVACSGMQPVPVVAGDICFHCRKIVSDVRVAGEIIDNTGHAMKFDTAGCMASYVKSHQQETPEGVFVTDFSNGRMVKASAAVFVPTMTGEGFTKVLDYIAYGTDQAAKEAAAKEKSSPMDWKAVVAAAVE